MLNENDLAGLVQEVRKVVGSIRGAKNFMETVSLSYVVVVENEEAKEAVLKVGNLLTEQAAKVHGLDLEVVPATEEELNSATEALKEYHNSKNKSSFEV